MEITTKPKSQFWPQRAKKQQPKTKTVFKGLINERSFVMCLVGKKGSGKSQLCLKLLTTWGGLRGVFDRVVIISPTFKAQFAGLWCAIDPHGLEVHEELSELLLETIITEQTSSSDKVLVISADNGDDWRRVAPSVTNKLISNSRHLHISCLFLAQKMTQLPVIVRSNSDVFAVFQANSHLEQTALFNEVSTVDRRAFDRMFNSATEKQYSFLVSSVLEGKLRFFKNFTEEITP